MHHEDNITFTINQVAKMLGVVSATIRNWEKNGLITVKRSHSNYRVFTLDDIETLKKIKEYSIEKHMGAEAIKMLLPTTSDTDVEQYVEQQKENFYSRKMMSEKWREIRKQQGYTLEEVSRAVGISVAHLSKLENSGNISLDMLDKLAHFYGESPLYFMESEEQDTRLVRKGQGEPIKLKDDPGLEMFSLVSMREHMMYPIFCTVEPGCGNMDPHTHNGEEFIYVISGTIEYTIGDEPTYVLRAGDSFYHRGNEPHSWKNASNRPAKMLWVHCAVTK